MSFLLFSIFSPYSEILRREADVNFFDDRKLCRFKKSCVLISFSLLNQNKGKEIITWLINDLTVKHASPIYQCHQFKTI